MSRLLNIEVDNRVVIKVDKSIKIDNISGIMKYGKDNDYPQLFEKLINGSITAKSAADVYAKFLVGNGFNDIINKIVIGKDERGKPVTVLGLLRKVAANIANHNGSFVHCNENLERKIVNLSIIPFKYCRFAKIDDTGYTSKIAVYNNWDKSDGGVKTNKIKWYNTFNLDQTAFNAQISALEGDTLEEKIKSFKGQVYFMFLDNQYLYPLSPFDPCYLDMDTEQQISIFKNNMTRNGMLKKTVLRVAEPSTTEEAEELKQQIKSWLGADGNSTLTLTDAIDENGDIKKSGAFAIDSIDSNIDDKLFENWQKQLANSFQVMSNTYLPKKAAFYPLNLLPNYRLGMS